MCLTGLNAFGQSGFRGEVVDLNGEPVSWASIKEITGVFSVKTDKNGYFTVTDIENKKYTVSIEA